MHEMLRAAHSAPRRSQGSVVRQVFVEWANVISVPSTEPLALRLLRPRSPRQRFLLERVKFFHTRETVQRCHSRMQNRSSE